MKLSTKGRYGLRALVDLAIYSADGPVSLSSIAQRQNISERYLEQLFAKLKKAGLVTSSRGARGGYQLGLPSDQISAGDVLRCLEGNLKAVECTADTENGCLGEDLCVTRYVWQRVNDSIARTVDEIKISQLVEESKIVHQKKSQADLKDRWHCERRIK